MIALLIWLMMFGLIVWASYYILGMLPIPDPPKKIIMVILGIIFILILLQSVLGGFRLPGVNLALLAAV